MRFTPEFIEKVRDATNIVEIIGPYTELKGSGSRLMGRCPFPDHSDKSPSFSVTEDQQLFFCYGCKKGGNVFTFLETFNGMNFPEAVEFLARRASIPMPEPEQGSYQSKGPSRDQKDTLLKINRVAGVFYHQQLKSLPEDHVAKKYLVKRGLDADIVEKFRLGVALDEWQGLYKHLLSKAAPMESAEALGLMKPKKAGKKGDSHFDQFRDRLIFPIFNSTSDVIGFGGRTFGDALPKYLNSSDSPVFNKSRVLYGIHETGKFIRAQDQAIVVEGYMDAISLYAAGIKNVVAILGTAFTPDHAKILKRYTLNVTMLLDGDEAGLNGAERSLPILLQAGLMPKGFALPEKMDPDDFVKSKGAEALKAEVERAPELFTLLLTKRWMSKYHGSPSEKVQIVEEAASVLARIPNRQLADLYLLEVARQLDVEIGWVRRAIATANQQQAAPQQARREEPQSPPTPELPPEIPQQEKIVLKGAPKDELFVLSLLLHFKTLLVDLLEAGPEEVIPLFTHPGVRRVLHYVVSKFQASPDSFAELAPQLATIVDNPAVVAMALMVGPEEGQAPDGFEQKLMGDYMNAIRNRHLKLQAKALAGQFKEGVSPEKLEEFMAIQRNRLAKKRDS